MQPWLSFTYNASDNFQANDAARNVYGDLLPNPQGKGSDYGVKLTLFDRRLFVELTYYKKESLNKFDGVSNTAAGNFEAIQNTPEDVYAPNWSVNLIQTYSFARETRLAAIPLGGISIGGSMNARGKSISGFAETAANVLNPNQPYHASNYEIFGAWVTYQRKLFRNRLDWRLQLNVRNLLDAYTVFPLRTVDARDGTNRPVNVIYRLSEPRTYTLTSTFKF